MNFKGIDMDFLIGPYHQEGRIVQVDLPDVKKYNNTIGKS